MNRQQCKATAVAPLKRWLIEQAWPLWRDHGIDSERGGFHESLDPSTLTCTVDFRRLRVLTRQIHVFSRAAAFGLSGAEAIVEMGLNFLFRRAKQEDGGYCWRFALDGTPTDQRRDFYDHAFVLLALSSAASVAPPALLRKEALRLVNWFDQQLAHPDGGYYEAVGSINETRRQNPHMHLLEALLAAFESFGDEIFLDKADAIVRLFLTRMFDHDSGALPEFFDDSWVPLPFDGRNQVEPGHHAEWIWLLDWHQQASRRCHRVISDDFISAVRAMQNFNDKYAVSRASGALLDALNKNGDVMSHGSRLWPQTERLKADAIRYSISPSFLVEAASAIAPFLDHPVPGLWFEHCLADGSFRLGAAPASSLYHLTEGILFVGD
jgi:mannose-6-phosphate isomerase